MRQIRDKDTLPEMTVRRLVHAMGFRYRLHVANLPGKPDLVFARLKKIIEVRGCFWHQHNGCIESHLPKTRLDYWKPKLKRNRQRDRDNAKALQAMGYDLLTVWECESKSKHDLAKKLNRFLNTRNSTH